MKEKYIVSACLVGYNCKYDGNNNLNKRLESFMDLGLLVPMCPEVIGGLDTPRIPSEILNDHVYNKDGIDVTKEFVLGASKVLEVCKKHNITKAILKENSPSCGVNNIYDGNFNNTLIKGSGITTRLLKNNGIEVFSENYIPLYDAIVVAAGNSLRTSLPYNKVLEFSYNKSCIEASIEPFISDYRCNKVIIVVNKTDYNLINELVKNSRVELVIGGETREESVLNGLNNATSKYVLIHDGARPYINEELVDNIINKLHDKCALAPFIIDSNNYDFKVDGKNIQTPQGYDTKLLKDIISKTNNINQYRDESSFVSKYIDIEYIEGSIKNKKLTDDKDIEEWRKYDENNL